MTEALPRIVAIGASRMLVFRDTDGHVQMIATDRLEGIGRHHKRPKGSVVIFRGERADEDGFVNEAQIILPADHPAEAFLALGINAQENKD